MKQSDLFFEFYKITCFDKLTPSLFLGICEIPYAVICVAFFQVSL